MRSPNGGPRRTGEDELPRFPAAVDGETDGVPQLRRHLPLVDEPGGASLQERRGLGVGQCEVKRAEIGILEVGDTGSMLQGGRRLPAPLGAFHLRRTADGESFGEHIINNPGHVARGHR